jgi:hypothetical protein
MEIHDVVANDEHAVGLLSYSLRRADGSVFNGRGVQVFHVRAGRVTESWGIQEDPAGLGAALEG